MNHIVDTEFYCKTIQPEIINSIYAVSGECQNLDSEYFINWTLCWLIVGVKTEILFGRQAILVNVFSDLVSIVMNINT